MNILLQDFLPTYPSIPIEKNTDINESINEQFKTELSKFGEFKPELMNLFNKHNSNTKKYRYSQLFIQRFLSQYTNYDRLLLFHYMGTGKSCAAVSVIENLKHNSTYNGCLYISPSRRLNLNFKNEILKNCPSSTYYKSDKELKDFYTFSTYKTFKNTKKSYDKYIIVLDEIHSYMPSISQLNSTNENTEIFNNLKYLIDKCTNCKILLLTGTPMKNSITDLQVILNLMLKDDIYERIKKYFDICKQYEKKNGIITQYDDGEEEEAAEEEKTPDAETPDAEKEKNEYEKAIDKISLLSTGYISYYDVSETLNVRPKYINNEKLATKIVYPQTGPSFYADVMTETQGATYTKLLTPLIGQDSKLTPNALLQSRKYAVFSKPDTTTEEYILTELDNNKSDPDKFISILEKYSIVFARSIELLQQASQNHKKIFIYNEWINDLCGINFFTKILDILEYTDLSKYPGSKAQYKGYIRLTGDNDDSVLKYINGTFNSEANFDGKKCICIIGSDASGTGYSFKDIRTVDIQTPWFNFAKLSQIIGRAIRYKSHKYTFEKDDTVLDVLDVDIYIRTPVYEDSDKCLNSDLVDQNDRISKLSVINTVYRILDAKYQSINLMINSIQKYAFDSDIIAAIKNFESSNELQIEIFDTGFNTSFYMYYTNELQEYTLLSLKQVFKTSTPDVKLTFELIYYYFKNVIIKEFIELQNIKPINFNEFIKDQSYTVVTDDNDNKIYLVLLEVLNKLITNNIPIKNRYNIEMYLREFNNEYFLVSDMYVNKPIGLSNYTHILSLYDYNDDVLFYKQNVNQIRNYINDVNLDITDIYTKNIGELLKFIYEDPDLHGIIGKSYQKIDTIYSSFCQFDIKTLRIIRDYVNNLYKLQTQEEVNMSEDITKIECPGWEGKKWSVPNKQYDLSEKELNNLVTFINNMVIFDIDLFKNYCKKIFAKIQLEKDEYFGITTFNMKTGKKGDLKLMTIPKTNIGKITISVPKPALLKQILVKYQIDVTDFPKSTLPDKVSTKLKEKGRMFYEFILD